jgi:phosphatidylethanolamine-binding protein (PEBP) family uncharacterized protein
MPCCVSLTGKLSYFRSLSWLHRDFFKLYALDSKLSLKASPAKAEVEKAMQGHILGQGELVGRYRR